MHDVNSNNADAGAINITVLAPESAVTRQRSSDLRNHGFKSHEPRLHRHPSAELTYDVLPPVDRQAKDSLPEDELLRAAPYLPVTGHAMKGSHR